jgi:uncharacterized protein
MLLHLLGTLAGVVARAAAGLRKLGLAVPLIVSAMAIPSHGQAADNAAAFKLMHWDNLMPPNWDPMKQLREQNPASVAEGSAAEVALMRELRAVLDNAPTRSELDGAKVKMSGYVVPLDTHRGQTREILLVPYFGACIHMPPPAANQIVHVVLPTPKALRTMDMVSVSGILKTLRQNSPAGMSGYAMRALRVEAYKPEPHKPPGQ